jgi:glycine betaine/choline ABC-type transport system substrate-binding protein
MILLLEKMTERERVVVRIILCICSLGLMLMVSQISTACVGKVLHIGIQNGPAEQVLAEMVAALVTERTGTSVKIVAYKDSHEIYAAVKKGDVGLVIENRARAVDMLGKQRDTNPKSAQEFLRREYQKTLNMVWLDGFGGPQPYAPVLSADTINTLPALPKLLGKLSGVFNDDSYNRLVKSAKSDEKPKKVARDFLKAKRLI